MTKTPSVYRFWLFAAFSGSLLPCFGGDIHKAAGDGDVQKIQELLSADASLVNLADTNGATPLHYAARKGHLSAAEALLKAGANMEATNVQKHSPVFCALHSGQVETAIRLIEKGAYLSGVDIYGRGAIHLAADGDRIELIKVVLSKGADINLKNSKHGSTALHAAVGGGSTNLVRFLIENNADLTAVDKDGNTPLHFTAVYGKLECARLLLAAGADANARNKLGFKPLELVKGQTNDVLAILLARHTATKWEETGTGIVGELGDPSLLVFEGNTTFYTLQLREALTVNPGYLLAAHAQAPLKPFMEVLREKLVGGYKLAGFPDAAVDVAYDEPGGRIRVKIAEGRRYYVGDVIVSGVSRHVAAEIKKRLTKWPEPNSAPFIRLSKSLDRSLRQGEVDTGELRIETNFSNDTDVSDNPPLWEPGDPAPLDDTSLPSLDAVVRSAIAEFGFIFPKFDIQRVPDPSTGKAALKVHVAELGPPGAIVEIDVKGNRKNTRSELLDYAGLRSGMKISRKLFQKVDTALLNSGRFMEWSITPEPATGPENPVGGVRLHFFVREYEQAPKLIARLSPEQEALRRCARWVAGFKERKEDLVLSVAGGTNGPFNGQVMGAMIISPNGELILNFNAPTNGPLMPAAFQMTRGLLGVYSPQTGSRLEVADSDLLMQLTLRLAPNKGPATNRWDLFLGGGFRSGPYTGRYPPLHFDLTIAPVVLMSLADDYPCKIAKGKLLVQQNDFSMVADARSGRLEKVTMNSEGFLFDLRLERSRLNAARTALEKQHSVLTNKFVAGHGLSTLLTFSAGQALHLLSRHSNTNDKASNQLAIAALEKLTANSLLAPIDSLFKYEKTNRFSLPMDSIDAALAQNSMASMFSGFAFKYCDRMFPRYSWPWTMARESVFILAGKGTYADAELKRLYESDQTGPIGSLVIAKLLENFNPGAAKNFALRGLVRLSAQDFQQDCELFLKPGGGLAESFATLTENLRSLSDAELQALADVLPASEARLLKDSAAALRTNPSKPSAVSLAPALERYWNDSLRADVRAGLQSIAFPKRDSLTPSKL